MKGDGDEMPVEGRFKRYKYIETPGKLPISKPYDEMTEEERLQRYNAIQKWGQVEKIEFKARPVFNLDLTNHPPPKKEKRYGFGSLDDRMYMPKTCETESAYWGLIYFIILSLVGQRDDPDADAPMFVGDKIIEILKRDDVSDFDKKKEIELHLKPMTDSFFEELVSLVNLLTDYDEVVREIAAWKQALKPSNLFT